MVRRSIPRTGKARLLDHGHDQAWAARQRRLRCRSRRRVHPDDRRFWFLAEHDGWMHLYVADVTSAGTPRAPAHERQAGRSRRSISLPTRRPSTSPPPRCTQASVTCYTMSIDGGARTQLDHGNRRLVGQGLARRQDARPDLLGGQRAARGLPDAEPGRRAPACAVTTSPTEEWSAHTWVEPKLVTYTARDGVAGLRPALHAGDGRREARIRRSRR